MEGIHDLCTTGIEVFLWANVSRLFLHVLQIEPIAKTRLLDMPEYGQSVFSV